MKPFAVCYVVIALIFGAMDFVWLTQVGPQLYPPYIGSLLAEEVLIAPAAAFYLIYIGGITGLAAGPSLTGGTLRGAFFRGAGLGLTAYAAYDLTNQATMAAWPWLITGLDLAWGAFVTGTAAWAAAAATRRHMPTTLAS